MTSRAASVRPARSRSRLLIGLTVGLALLLPGTTVSAAGAGTYRNPLLPVVPGDGVVESCADPTVIRGQEGEGRWYMYCTTDPLNDDDRGAGGGFNFRLIPMLSSLDLINWTYEGDAFVARPEYAAPSAGLWAPEIAYYPETGSYHLYYTVTDTTFPGGGSAIGVATGPTPLGPWTHASSPAVEPHGADCCGPDSRRWVFDPEVLRTGGVDYLYYGSYFGGISVRVLAETGLTTDAATQTNVAIANKFEGAEVEFRDGWYYLFVSATDCCRGPLTGYSVFVGRAESPTGPFVDRDGIDLNDDEGPNEADPTNGRAGGTPVLTMNGNRWVGLGHNTVFQDLAGQWWTIYHAVDVNDPYFEGAIGFTKRPALLDAIDWIGGWPTVRGGAGASDTSVPAPAAQPGDTTTHRQSVTRPDRPAGLTWTEGFEGDAIDPTWTWVRAPAPDTIAVTGGVLRMETQAADLFEDSNNASVLLREAPGDDWLVETRVRLSVPAEGCCFNFVQAGLVAYGDDDNFIKLAHVSIWNTRQTEFAKELGPVPAGYPRYGNTVVGAPGEWTWLRVVKRTGGAHLPEGLYGGTEQYTAYTSLDGITWTRGGTWTHHLGNDVRIGLVAMGGSGFEAEFDYVTLSGVRR
jgi:arabinan endo-1,5-alpha-L-arabinosidase